MLRTLAFTALLVAAAAPALANRGHPAGRMTGPGGKSFLLEKSEVEADIGGGAARVVLRQTFRNPFRRPVEVVYRFPLPHSAAIDRIRVVVGSRVIEAEIARSSRAAEEFKKAREKGKTAALTRQDRPNVFTQRVTNILPGEPIVVEVGFVTELDFVDGRRRFTLPVVTGPRYGGYGTPRGAPRSRLDLNVRLDAGFPLRDLRSDSHAIVVRPIGETAAEVTLADFDRLPVKDFNLTWSVLDDAPAAVLTTHRSTWDGFLSLVIVPDRHPAEELGREVVFVLDTSGSMKGEKLDTAKRAIARALATLGPGDRFRLVRFSSEAEEFARAPLPAVAANVQAGLAWLEGLTPDGGTEIIRGVRLAFAGSRDRHRMRVVHFVSDGLVQNEREILSKVTRVVGNSRIYPLGIGSSPNRYLLERMADLGRGAADYLRHDADDTTIDETVGRFVRRIRVPAVTDLVVDWGGLPVIDVVPTRIPDLLVGKPVVIRGRYTGPAEGEVVLHGIRNGFEWTKRIPVALPDHERRNAAIATLWARSRIRELMLGTYSGEFDDVTAEVTTLGLRYGLLTAYTSFFAVEQTVVNTGELPEIIREPLPLPEGYEDGGWYSVLLGYRPPKPAKAAPAPKRVSRPLVSRATFPPINAARDLHLSILNSWQTTMGSYAERGDLVSDVGATALVLLAHAASDRRDREKNVRGALRWLRGRQIANGRFGGRDKAGWMLDHVLATAAMVEHGAASRKTRSWIRMQKAVDLIVEAGRKGFGDRLTAALAVIALRRAGRSGCKLPPDAFAAIRKELDLANIVALDGTALAATVLARHALGDNSASCPALREAGDALLRLPAPVGNRKDPLFLFLSTAAAKRLGGRWWKNWSAPLDEISRREMLPTEKDELIGPAGSRVGRVTATTLFGLARQCYRNPGGVFILR